MEGKPIVKTHLSRNLANQNIVSIVVRTCSMFISGTVTFSRVAQAPFNWLAQTSSITEVVDRTLTEPTDASITSQDHQLRFEDAGNLVEQQSTLTFSKLYSAVNPYPDTTPRQILERVVQFPNLSWGPSSTLISDFEPLQALINASQIHKNLIGDLSGLIAGWGMYRYLKCNWKIGVRLNTTQYHQGTLCVGWKPDGLSSDHFSAQHIIAHNGIVLSASQQDQCTFTIPFFSSRPHYDLLDYPNSHPVRIGIRVINPLLSSNPAISDTVPILITVQMTDVELYGILPQQYIVPPPYVKQSSQNKGRVAKEAHAKDAQGLSAPGVLSLVKPLIKEIPFASEIIDVGKMIFSNLDKPTSDQSLTYTRDVPNRGHNFLAGLDYCEPLTSFPSFNVAKDLNIETSDMSIIQFAKKPALFFTTTSSSAGVVLKLNVHPLVYRSTFRSEPDFLAFASSFYGYWRGSIKFLFHFVGTPFYSCRYKISVSHAPEAPSGGTDNGTGFYSRIVDVKGDAWVSISVPYLSRRIWSYTNILTDTVADYAFLIVEALTDVQGSSLPADALYYMNVYRAAGDDYQLSMLTKTRYLTPPTLSTDPPYRKQCSITQKFAESFPGVTELNSGVQETGLLMADTASTISDTCKRFIQTSFGTVSQKWDFPGFTSSDTSFHDLGPFHTWAYAFAYWRGSRRFKICPVSQDNISILTFHQDGLEGSALAGDPVSIPNYTNSAVCPWHCVESYYPSVLTDTTHWNTATPISLSILAASDASTTWKFLAAGDDFVFLYPIPPIVSPFLPLPLRKKALDSADLITQTNNLGKNPLIAYTDQKFKQ